MRHYRSCPAAWLIAFLAVAPLGGLRVGAQDLPPPIPAQEQPEVLSRGPVHEAFAEPVTLDVQPSLIAPSRPPPNIDEVPPAERPQGEQFVWIPGYWSWDADRAGYIWVSACWRLAPPGMSWVPGYWSQLSAGWEWISGFWAPAGVREIVYLPVPPAVAEVEPSGSPPSADMIWVPPCVRWVQGQYVRRAGYWLAAQPDWVWVPPHYVVTPRGYIFVQGHWDYSLERRGVLFAPVYFPALVHGRVNFTYSPSIVLDLGLLRVSLFAYPRYHHYYFGDYYDDAYLRIGIFPWFDSRRLHSWYDPVFEYDRWHHQRVEPRWEERERTEYDRRRADKELRPARTFREQESRAAKLPEPQQRGFQVTRPLTGVVTHRETSLKFERINSDTRQQVSRQANTVNTFRDERNRWESTVPSPRAAQSPQDHKTAVMPALEHKETIFPREHKDTGSSPAQRPQSEPSRPDRAVTPPAEHREVITPVVEHREVAPVRQHSVTVTPPTQRPQASQPTPGPAVSAPPPAGHREVITPAVEHREVAPARQYSVTVTPPVQRPQAVQPTPGTGVSVTLPAGHREVITPAVEHREVAPVRQRNATMTPSAEPQPAMVPQTSQRESASVAPREVNVPQPERVQIPRLPTGGGSGGTESFQKGQPVRPADEDGASEGKDGRRDKTSPRDMRRGSNP